ncbi:hypothetical protein [Marinobacter sp.]|uniref:hypothetical protein n=1 Tax=Marinobacter sp. TaxID=50741 RepID=UPI00257F17CB|nr:hypothetical protein [Marinobacter sp.]
MTRRPNCCPMSLEDMESGNELLRAPLGFCPQIDKETRMILGALLDDMFNHLHAHHDPEKCEDAWASAQFMHDILSDILNRTPENTRIPDTLEWLKPEEPQEQKPMSFEEIDEILKPVFDIDRSELHPSVLEHLEEQLKDMLDLIEKDKHR